ncbi:unnamed protein product [Onchocerca ochengi]|uniref:Uncharacterized protein n=1 Tax=Onchocerca ochengi TaxID=42157 RepID=A0A182EC07_ONCOC|nr:unnamed protein product [Onchocerca ochengi]
MTKQSDDVALQNDPILPSSSKINKLKFSKLPYGSLRLSHLLSKISRKDKKVTDKYYIPAEPPFTSTPDMSGEEDGVEVSYVETESEFSENTIPAVDSANVKSTSNRLIYVDGAALEDSSTTTTVSADYSSSSATGNINIEGQMIRTNSITCKSSDQEVVQSTTQTVTTTDINANIDENASCKSRTNLARIWFVLEYDI